MRLLLLMFLLTLTGCAAQQNTGDIKAARASAKMAVGEKAIASKPGEVDFSCKTSSDCKIKDVGSCCGYRPACVNKDSKTYPEQVKAECSKSGMSSICGFPSISSCTCTNNKCEGVAGSLGEEAAQ